MKKEVFNQIVVDNIDSKLISVIFKQWHQAQSGTGDRR